MGYLRPVGIILGYLRPAWGYLRAILGRSRDYCEAILGYLRPAWGYLRPAWGYLRPAWGYLRAILGYLGAILGCLEPSWGSLGISKPVKHYITTCRKTVIFLCKNHTFQDLEAPIWAPFKSLFEQKIVKMRYVGRVRSIFGSPEAIWRFLKLSWAAWGCLDAPWSFLGCPGPLGSGSPGAGKLGSGSPRAGA